MPDIQAAPVPSDPVAIIRAAVREASRRGEVISTGPDLGVLCDSSHAPQWVRDPRAPMISPLGAVLLVHQPAIPEADPALAHVLGANTVWVIGFDEAVAGKQAGGSSYVRGAPARLYGQGFVAGAEFRATFCVPRRHVETEATPRLVAADPAAAPSLLQQLLASLTLPQALEAVAETVPIRGLSWETMTDIAHQLLETAAEWRAMGL